MTTWMGPTRPEEIGRPFAKQIPGDEDGALLIGEAYVPNVVQLPPALGGGTAHVRGVPFLRACPKCAPGAPKVVGLELESDRVDGVFCCPTHGFLLFQWGRSPAQEGN